MDIEKARSDIADGRALIDEILDAGDDELSDDELAKVDMLWRAVESLQGQAARITMTPRQLATLHKAVSLDGRDGREFALIALQDDDGGALLVQQGIGRQRIPRGAPAEDLDAATESTS